MTWFDADVALAIVLEFATMAIWLRMRHKIKPWVWWSGMVALLLVVVHCAGYWTSTLWLSQATALSNAALVLLIVFISSKSVNKVEKLEARVEVQNVTIDKERSAAHQLTEVLNGYKDKIQYYEDQAAREGLPLFPK